MIKSGIVMEIRKKSAIIITKDGEFLEVSLHSKRPNIGEEFKSSVYKNNSFLKYAMIAASLFLFLSFGGYWHLYNTAYASVIIDINPSIKLITNRWDKIIKIEALNNDGVKIVNSTDVRNKDLNEGLTLIVEESKKQKYITDEYKSNKTIAVQVKDNKKNIDLTKFEKKLAKEKLKYEIKKDIKEKIKENKKRNQDNKQKIKDQKDEIKQEKEKLKKQQEEAKEKAKAKKEEVKNKYKDGQNNQGNDNNQGKNIYNKNQYQNNSRNQYNKK